MSRLIQLTSPKNNKICIDSDSILFIKETISKGSNLTLVKDNFRFEIEVKESIPQILTTYPKF